MPVLLFAFLGSIGFSLLMVTVARLTHNRHRLRGPGDLETTYVTSICTLYGIFIAFVIFTVWTRYNEAQENLTREANNVAEIYRTAAGINDPLGAELQDLTVSYARSVVQDEWRTMTRGTGSQRTQAIVDRVWGVLNRMDDQIADSVVRDHLLSSWIELDDLRRVRLLWSRTGVSHYIYTVLFVGALITVGMSSIFIVDDFQTHAMKAAALAAVIGLMVATVWALGHPFRGELALPPDAFRDAIRVLNNG